MEKLFEFDHTTIKTPKDAVLFINTIIGPLGSCLGATIDKYGHNEQLVRTMFIAAMELNNFATLIEKMEKENEE